MTAAASPRRPAPTGEVHATAAYTAGDFRRRTGLNDFTWRAARKAGLRVVKFGRKVYVRGSDWLDFLARVAAGEVAEQTND